MKKILIVDDEPEIMSILRFRVSNWGYDDLAAYSGQEALDLLEEEQPDLILLDVMMPGMDGFELLQKLKAKEKTAKIPVIMISVMTGKDSIDRGKKVGADHYLTKPYDAQQLHNLIVSLIGEGEEGGN